MYQPRQSCLCTFYSSCGVCYILMCTFVLGGDAYCEYFCTSPRKVQEEDAQGHHRGENHSVLLPSGVDLTEEVV